MLRSTRSLAGVVVLGTASARFLGDKVLQIEEKLRVLSDRSLMLGGRVKGTDCTDHNYFDRLWAQRAPATTIEPEGPRREADRLRLQGAGERDPTNGRVPPNPTPNKLRD
jgi:hypothetical protein